MNAEAAQCGSNENGTNSTNPKLANQLKPKMLELEKACF
jgi:hypothetical protein